VGSRGSETIFVTVFSAGSGMASIATTAALPDAEPPSVRIQQEVVPPEGLDYTIQAGDTLLAIGLRYGLPWERLADENALTERSLLQIGQVIHVPGSGVAAVAARLDVETELYQVQPGDTLFGIAVRRGLTWQDVAAVNGFGEQTVLQIAQVIFVPKTVESAGDTATVAAADDWPSAVETWVSLSGGAREEAGIGGSVAKPDWYTIAPGDTIISVALRYQLDWQALMALNGLEDDTLLQVGQRLQLR